MPDGLGTLHWTAVPLLLAVLVAGFVFDRHRRRAPTPVPAKRVTAFATGLAVFVVAMMGPLDWVGENRLMSMHMVQHLLLLSVVPALMFGAFSLDGLRRRARRWPVWVPAACMLGGLVVIWVLHVPAILEPGLTRPALHDTQHLALIAGGALLTWPLTGSGALFGFGAVAYIVAAEIGIGVLGIFLAWYPNLIYESYAAMPRMWGLEPETDQSLAGALLLVIEEPFLAVEFAILFIRALGDTTYGG